MKPSRWPRGRGVRRSPGEMNRTEAAYAHDLEWAKRAGTIAEYWFERIKLKLADNTFYTPDFFILKPDGTLEVHEVKGHWEDDARVKIKVAADQFPFEFVAIYQIPKRDGGGWKTEVI